MTESPSKTIHQGRNVKRFREMLGIKQEALAYELGEDWNQKKISLLEQKEEIEASLLAQIAEVLKLPVEAFQNFDEEQAVNIIAKMGHQIAVAVEEQAHVSEDINRQVSRIADLAGDSYHNSEQAAAVSSDLERNAESLYQLVERFKK